MAMVNNQMEQLVCHSLLQQSQSPIFSQEALATKFLSGVGMRFESPSGRFKYPWDLKGNLMLQLTGNHWKPASFLDSQGKFPAKIVVYML